MDEKMKELSQVLPSEIEARSFEIITEELGERTIIGTYGIPKNRSTATTKHAAAFSANMVSSRFRNLNR